MVICTGSMLRIVGEHLRRYVPLDSRATLAVAIQPLGRATIDAISIDEAACALPRAHAGEGLADDVHQRNLLPCLGQRELRTSDA